MVGCGFQEIRRLSLAVLSLIVSGVFSRFGIGFFDESGCQDVWSWDKCGSKWRGCCGPLSARSGHWYAGEKSKNFHERAMRALVRFRTTGRVCPECRLIDAIVLRPTHSEIKTRTPNRNPAPPCTLVDDLARLRHHQPNRRTSHGKSRFKSLRSTIVARKPLPF